MISISSARGVFPQGTFVMVVSIEKYSIFNYSNEDALELNPAETQSVFKQGE